MPAKCGCYWGTPAPRARGGPNPPLVSERYERSESTTSEFASADTDAAVLTFSGMVDLVRLSARTNGALFTLTDRLDRETHVVTVLPNQTEEVHYRCERVKVRNLVAGSNAAVMVTGLYGSPAETVEGDV